MDLIKEAHQRLFPENELSYHTELEYNRRLSPFNANIKLYANTLKVNLNLQWKDIDDEIKIGLIQSLMIKIFRKRAHTPNIGLYNNFIKNIPLLTPKTKTDPLLEASFQRINQQFFHQQMERPNLEWGYASFRKLASYNFHNDTVTVSSLFQNSHPEVLDYLMYHELLHKHHKFKHNAGRSSYHSPAFKADERRYPHQSQIEREIGMITRQKAQRRRWLFW